MWEVQESACRQVEKAEIGCQENVGHNYGKKVRDDPAKGNQDPVNPLKKKGYAPFYYPILSELTGLEEEKCYCNKKTIDC